MIKEFIDFTSALFPSINPYVKEQTKLALKQFEDTGEKLTLFDYSTFDVLSQGDVLGNVPFLMLDDQGKVKKRVSKGMIISNTCSCDHDDAIVIAPMFELNELEMDTSSVVKNLNYHLFYLPQVDYKEYVVDFSLMNTFNKQLLNELIRTNEVTKENSLNIFGFYLLITKLTICFMRPEDEGIQESRYNDFKGQHRGVI